MTYSPVYAGLIAGVCGLCAGGCRLGQHPRAKRDQIGPLGAVLTKQILKPGNRANVGGPSGPPNFPAFLGGFAPGLPALNFSNLLPK